MPVLWPGETVAILAGGPSLDDRQVAHVRAAHAAGLCRAVVVNDSYERAPWADMLYACDGVWWEEHRPDFAGLRVTQDPGTPDAVPGVVRVPLAAVEYRAGLSFDPLRINSGGNGGFQAVNVAILAGARRLLLLGIDLQRVGGRLHHYPDHTGKLHNPDTARLADWRLPFAAALPQMRARGIEAVNCSPASVLADLGYPTMTIEEALPDAAAEAPSPKTPTAKRRVEMNESRVFEQRKYERAYTLPHYRMGDGRMKDAVADLAALPARGSYLDVGCGRGEMLAHAADLGFGPVNGVEVVPALIDGTVVVRGEAHDLPFATDAFDVVTLFDVIEHIPAGDDELVCRELARVARRHVLLTANNRPSALPDGTDLHINRRPYEEWHRLFAEWFAPAVVTWIKGPRAYVSEGWRVDFDVQPVRLGDLAVPR